MKQEETVSAAAALLGKRGGKKTLQKYGRKQLQEWGKRGGKFGKLGGWPKGRPRKASKEKTSKA